MYAFNCITVFHLLENKTFSFSSATREMFLKAAYEGNLTSLEALLPQVDVNHTEAYESWDRKVSSGFYSVINQNSKLFKHQGGTGKFF